MVVSSLSFSFAVKPEQGNLCMRHSISTYGHKLNVCCLYKHKFSMMFQEYFLIQTYISCLLHVFDILTSPPSMTRTSVKSTISKYHSLHYTLLYFSALLYTELCSIGSSVYRSRTNGPIQEIINRSCTFSKTLHLPDQNNINYDFFSSIGHFVMFNSLGVVGAFLQTP